MVMNFAVFETNLHMTHHYKLIKSAKSVINTSAPRTYLLKSNKTVSSLNSRVSSPTSTRISSRPTSNCDDHRRRSEMIDGNGRRSQSLPPRPCTRRNKQVVPQNYIKSSSLHPKIKVNNSNKIPLTKDTPNTSTLNSPSSSKTPKVINSSKKCPIVKTPIPTPRTLVDTSVIPDYEYLQFSLRITEDIIRNDLYSPKEMRRVFNSHIEANRGRLNIKKMLLQIDHLCKELDISKKSSNLKSLTEECFCQTSLPSKESLIKKIVNGDHVSDEEIKELTDNELEVVINGILQNESENIESTQMTDESSEKDRSNPSLNVIHNNVQNFTSLSDDDLKMISSSEFSEVTIKDEKTDDLEQRTVESLPIVTKENDIKLCSETAKEKTKEIKSTGQISEPRSNVKKLKTVFFCDPRLVKLQTSFSDDTINTLELITVEAIDSVEENEAVELKKQLSAIEENESQEPLVEKKMIARETVEPEKSYHITPEQNISSSEESKEDESIELEQLKSESQVINVPNASLNSLKSVSSESKTTQTLLAVDEDNKYLNTSINDYVKDDCCNLALCCSTKIESEGISKNIENTKISKDKFISSITQFILEKTFSKSESNFSFPEENWKSINPTEKSSGKSEFISSIEKIINSKTEDLYQYSTKKPPAKEELPMLISVEDLEKYQTKNSANELPHETSKRKNSENIYSDGEVSKLSSSCSIPQKIRGRIIKRTQPSILEHLKKYEQDIPEKNNFSKPCVYDYEIRPPYDSYIPKFKKSMFFPSTSTQTSSTDFNFKAGFNDNLLSDGEIQNISTDLSE